MKRKPIALILSLLLVFVCFALPYTGVAADGEQEITLALENEPDGIDPNVTSNSFASPFLSNAFEGLVSLDENNELAPALAESWEISEDMLTYTFKLRPDLKWSDGTPLTANDFVYTIQRVLTPETAAQYLTMVTDYIVNAQEFYDGEVEADELGVSAPDENTLVIELKAPALFFLDILSMPVYSPVQQATVEANGDKWTLSPETYICNGPFKITEINMGESVVLEKNEFYWNAENVQLEKITFRYIKDSSTALTAFDRGEIDGQRSVPIADYPRLKMESDEFHIMPTYATTYYLINCGKAPYDNPLVRKAINLAIDRQAIIDNILQSGDMPASALVSPGYFVDGKDYVDGRPDFDILPTAQPEKAQELLAEAGFPNGEGFPTLELSYYTNPQVKPIAEAMAQMLQDNLNINVEITNEEWKVYYDGVQAGNYDVAAMGWGADYLNPMTFLPLYVSDDVMNNAFYSNPAYDEAVAKARLAPDAATAVADMRAAEEILMADYPMIPLYHRSTSLMMKDYVKGWVLTPTSNWYFKGAYVEK